MKAHNGVSVGENGQRWIVLKKFYFLWNETMIKVQAQVTQNVSDAHSRSILLKQFLNTQHNADRSGIESVRDREAEGTAYGFDFASPLG